MEGKKKEKKRLSLFVGGQLVDTSVEMNAGILIYLTQTCQWDVITTAMTIIIIDMLKVSWSLATIDSHSDTR